MARRLPQLALAALLTIAAAAPPLALAQATPGAGAVTVTESADNEATPRINIAECNGTVADTFTYHWNASGVTTATVYDLYAYDSQGSNPNNLCPPPSNTDNPVHSYQVFTGQAPTQSVTDAGTVSSLLKQPSLNITCDGGSKTLYLCVRVTGDNTKNLATGSVQLDLSTAPVPTSVSITGGDTILHVSWANGTSGGGATTGYRIYWGPSGQALTSSHENSGIGSTTFDIAGLTNDASYDVQVTSLTVAGNESAKTAVVTGAPFLVDDFWRLYKTNQGTETGGCGAGAGGLLALLALVPLALRARRRQP